MPSCCESALPTDSDHSLPFELRESGPYWVITYRAMAGPCELHIACNDASEARELASLAHAETARIESKFSRYRDDSVVQAINRSQGRAVVVDAETAQLLDFAANAYRLSDGRFDITSGVLRRAWRFDGTEFKPDHNLIASLRELVGWDKVQFENNTILLRSGMEIDLGGLGKEYAADRVAQMLHEQSGRRLMVNFGGDIRATGSCESDEPWHIGIENPDPVAGPLGEIALRNGGVATSGDARRYCIVNGMRLSHILDPHTGWPVKGAPQSVTVLARFCLEAGLLSTMAMLQGPGAEQFLAAQQVLHHCVRDPHSAP